MTDPISSFRRVAQMDASSRQATEKVKERAPETAPQTSPNAQVMRSDEVKLSEAAQKAMQEPEFDRAKVEAIKTAIQQGQYPMDSRRIAENFIAIEKMIKE